MSVARDTVAGLRVRRSPDTTLLDHALRGDAVAFSEIHRRYSGRVFAFCLARLMSVDAAQDATQEVFLRLLSADPDQVRSISGWLFGVARHACIDIARARNRRVPTEAETIEGELGALAAGRSAEEQMLSQAQANDVFLALRRMKPRYRSVLVLRELHGQSMTEIAEALSVNMGAAYTLLSRARDAFGKAYAGTHDLPSQCREAVELVYRETGSGISEAQSEKLQAHLAECSNCRREARYAKDRPLFAGLLPLLPMSWGSSAGLLGRALARLGGAAPSLGAASPAVPAAAPWAPAAVATALSAAVVLGSVVAPSGLASHGSAERARAAVAPTAISSPAVTAGTDGASDQAHGESEELRALLLYRYQQAARRPGHRQRNRKRQWRRHRWAGAGDDDAGGTEVHCARHDGDRRRHQRGHCRQRQVRHGEVANRLRAYRELQEAARLGACGCTRYGGAGRAGDGIRLRASALRVGAAPK